MLSYSEKDLKNTLTLPFKEKVALAKKVIAKTLSLAKNPYISVSGGLHSTALYFMVNEIKKVNTVIIDLKLNFEEINNVIKYLVENDEGVKVIDSPYSEKAFMSSFGLPIFKGLQGIIKPSEYKKFGITNECRVIRKKLFNKFSRTNKPDAIFLGILAYEKPQRYKAFIGKGFIYKKGNTFISKPLAHFTTEELIAYIKSVYPNYPLNLYFDGNKVRKGDLGCWMCSVGFTKKGYGNFGFLYRNKKCLWAKLIYEYNLVDILEKIFNFTKNKKIAKFMIDYELYPKIGADFDGVLCKKLNYASAKNTNLYFKSMRKAKPYLINYFYGKNTYIFTGRKKGRDEEITFEWLKKNGYPYLEKRLFFLNKSRTRKNMQHFKLTLIKKLGIKIYYDDDAEIIKYLNKKLKNVKCVLVP